MAAKKRKRLKNTFALFCGYLFVFYFVVSLETIQKPISQFLSF